MGQKTILTPVQREFLELVLKEPYLLENYYWTGGTVLADFYLHHRDSYDIDLFTESQEVHLPSINKFVGITGTIMKTKRISHTRFLGLHSYVFLLRKGKKLKVDFNYYPFSRIDKRKNWHGLEVDSLLDIAVNKIHTISTKPRARDFVDVYFILKQKKEGLDLSQLIKLAKNKFDWHIEPTQLGENFTKVVTFKDYPKMLVPFSQKKMEEFFLDLAKSLKKEIFK
jgi:predicted nucleotidyltransferase component of viral defense system